MAEFSEADKLVRMVNQIAANFECESDQSKSVAGVLDHVTRFWTVEMKQTILARHATGKSGLSEIAEAAISRLGQNYGGSA